MRRSPWTASIGSSVGAGARSDLSRAIQLHGLFQDVLLVQGLVRDAVVDPGLGVEEDESSDDASAALKFDREFVSDDAAKRPAEQVVWPVGIRFLDSVGMGARQIPKRLQFGLPILRNLLYPDNRAVQNDYQESGTASSPRLRDECRRRCAGALLQNLNGNYLLRGRRVCLQPPTQTAHGGRIEQGAYRNIGTD